MEVTHSLRADLIRKYDVPVPRYTSYPTVPAWNTAAFTPDQWLAAVKRSFEETNSTKGISLYIHLPFCESLCTYCACTTRITKNHGVEAPYVDCLLDEWKGYTDLFGAPPVIRELHLGGGTPTFFAPAQLERLIQGIMRASVLHPDAEFSVEGHPNNTTIDHLHVLAALGFGRISFGVQDLDPRVQKAIHRIQPLSNLTRVVDESRSAGYHSISFDLVYGLPFQTPESVRQTALEVVKLRPDRVAFYSYAHVPWIKPGQRGYEDKDLPTDVQKRTLYETGRSILLGSGYRDIGMDHFSLPEDSLWKARASGHLHRNFMGYTTTQSELLIGLGTSAISDAKYAYAQNEKRVEDYRDRVQEHGHALFRGHVMSDDDALIRSAILNLVCQGYLPKNELKGVLTERGSTFLREMECDGLIAWSDSGISVTPSGWMTVRNLCSALDRYYSPQPVGQMFSRAM